mmetsp:Transcript_43432/g.80948  ORF Transcript_43432/g.80948 Transcript_43432/m.80948 type:complete len:129 (+) Transcript_43432:52-438(+)
MAQIWLRTLMAGFLLAYTGAGIRTEGESRGHQGTNVTASGATRGADCCCYCPGRGKTYKNYGDLNAKNCPDSEHGYRGCLKGSNNNQPCSGGRRDNNDLFCDLYKYTDCFAPYVRGVYYRGNGWTKDD